jgi:energy-coupling factor transporter ATP-binding protein EcfA2
MYARLGFAVAINVEPDVLLVDEVLSVGDEAFQRKCLDRVRAFQREGRTILLVSHATDTVRQIAHRAAVFDHGRLIEVGEVGDAIRTFRDTLNRDHETHAELEPPPTAIDPVTGELPVVVAPVELVPDPDAEVKISSVEIEYPNPELGTLVPGRPLTVKVGYHATGMITDVVFAIEIFDDDGNRLLGTTTDVLDQPIHAVAGDGHVVFRFEQVPLLDGTFHLTFQIHTRDGGTVYDQREYEDSFQVTNRSRTRGLVLFPIKVEHLYHF